MSRRELERLRSESFDLLVVGAGIHGACIALSAALAGQRVALIERDDFGAGASANSLKILHGGLRYLQHADLGRFRSSVQARRQFCRFAPGLVRPLPCLMPLSVSGVRSPWMLGPALLLNAAASADRNRGVEETARLPAGGLIAGDRCCALLAPLAKRQPFAGAIWWDAIMIDSERLLVNVVMAAAAATAIVANRVAARRLIRSGDRVAGVEAVDARQGEAFEIRARHTIVAAGAAAESLLPPADPAQVLSWVYALNVVLKRSIGPQYAVALAGGSGGSGSGTVVRKQGRELFFVPWNGTTMVGTGYALRQPGESDAALRARALAEFLADAQAAAPAAALGEQDVARVHWGALPTDAAGSLEPSRSAKIDLPEPGLTVVTGEKYTSAPMVARRALQHSGLASVSIAVASERDHSSGVAAGQVVARLVARYGSEAAARITQQAQEPSSPLPVLPDSEVTLAEVRHAVRVEQATTLGDVVLRRTGLGAAGLPPARTLQACATIVAEELGWDEARTQREVDSLSRDWPWAPA